MAVSYSNSNGIAFIETPISYEDFYCNFMEKNVPCLINSFLTRDWRVAKEWVTENNEINFHHLRQRFSSYEVPVSDCGQRYFNSQVRCGDMSFSKYLKYWKEVIHSAYDYSRHQCLYLKDWHFFLDLSVEHSNNPFYEVPDYFRDDWLNSHWLKDQLVNDPISDYRFVYMGPQGSNTPFHKDVYSSYSWSANVIGEKDWILIHPNHERLLREEYSNGKELPFDVEPLMTDENFVERINPIRVTQKSGQVMFVPSDWMHQVRNTKDTISINHNWFNACNLSHVWVSLLRALREVQIELSDLKLESSDWSHECQKLLRIHHGLNLQDLLEILETRVKQLVKESSLLSSSGSSLSNDVKFRHEREVSVVRNFIVQFQLEIASSPLSTDLQSLLQSLHHKVSQLV
jgi:hypothetical protein